MEQHRLEYIGKLPNVFREKSCLKDIDQLVLNLEKYIKKRETPPCDSPVKIGGILCTVTPVNIFTSGYGDVFEIKHGNQSFALKIHRNYSNEIDEKHGHGIYSEAAFGSWFSKHPCIKDLSHFYASNPSKKWILMEFINDSNGFENRIGPTMRELGHDIKTPYHKNKVNGVLVDYGGAWNNKTN